MQKGPMKIATFIALSLSVLLFGCASTPAVPYWQNPQWVNALATAVHQNIRYPKTAAAENFPSGTAIVTFYYDNGRLRAPHIVQSTGSSMLDASILEQIANIKPLMAKGLDTTMPHGFQMIIYMNPPELIELYRAIQGTLAKHINYPFLGGSGGMVLAEFKYRNGVIIDPRIKTSSGHLALDQAVMKELQTTALPKPPDWLRNKTFYFELPYCFGSGTNLCATTLTEVRYVPAGELSNSSKAPCAEVGYKYRDGHISNVRIMKSSGDQDLDKHALAEAAEGKLARPPARFERATSDYTVPVCSNDSPKTGTGPAKQ